MSIFKIVVSFDYNAVKNAGFDAEILEDEVRSNWEYDGSGAGFGCRDFDAYYDTQGEAQQVYETLLEIADRYTTEENTVLDVGIFEFLECGECQGFYEVDEICECQEVQCAVEVCYRIVESEGMVCDKCIEHSFNGGGCITCESCHEIMCDNCGVNRAHVVLGGEGSPFWSCQSCEPGILEIEPSDRDFQIQNPRSCCQECGSNS